MNYIIEFADGCHGILPNDNMEYSVSRGRIILYKDGDKILDKEITSCPSGKCEIVCGKDVNPEIKVVPVDGEAINNDVNPEAKVNSEYNIGNMLPQGMGVGVPTLAQQPLMTAESSSEASTEDGEVFTEISGAAIGAAKIAGVTAAATAGGIYGISQILKLIEMGTDKVITTAQRPKYKKVLDAYYDLFMQKDAPKFSNLKKSKYFATQTGDKKNPIIGILQKYGFSREYACVNYSYNDNPVCGCFMDKKYKASFDVFTYLINGGDVIKVNFGWTKHLQTKVLEYKKYEKYYIAYMHLMLGFIDNAFKDIVRDLNTELKKHQKDIKDLKKESAEEIINDINLSLTLTESASDYIEGYRNDILESAKDVVLNFDVDVNVPRKLRVLIIETALLQARLKKTKDKGKAAELKREIIANEKEKRALLEGQTNEVKAAVRKIEKLAIKEAKKEVKVEDVTESVDDEIDNRIDELNMFGDSDDTDENKALRSHLESELNSIMKESEKDKEDNKEDKTPLSIKILEEKIEKHKERLANAEKEPRKHTSLINELKKEISDFEDSLAVLKSKIHKEINESEEDLLSDEVIIESGDDKSFGVSVLATLAVFSIAAAVRAFREWKRKKKMDKRFDALAAYPIKHPDAPKLSQISRKKYIINAYDNKRGSAVVDNDDRASGMYEYVYYYKKKEIVVVQSYGDRFACGICKDLPAKIKEHKEYVYALIIIAKHGWITPSIAKWLDEQVKENDTLKKQNNGKLVPDKTKKIKVESEMDNYVDILGSFVNEAANIDTAIKDIISLLNQKGYSTRYSSAGHYHLRKKEDREPDGVYTGKLYSDARVQFKGTYHFGAAPKYWFWKKVDGDDYLDIIPIGYAEKDGTPDEAFSKWRDNYLGTLKRWAESLPSANKKKEDDPTPEDKNIKEESARIDDLLSREFESIFRENGLRD